MKIEHGDIHGFIEDNLEDILDCFWYDIIELISEKGYIVERILEREGD